MTDASGIVVWSADYKPFGDATITVSTITNNLRFPGQYYDAETGTHYNYYRDYNPVIGRYIEADPIGIAGGVNLFIYVTANPINNVDILGLKKKCPECDAQLPGSPVKEVALTCFAEATPGCADGADEKRAITDVVYNRVEANRRVCHWGQTLKLTFTVAFDKLSACRVNPA